MDTNKNRIFEICDKLIDTLREEENLYLDLIKKEEEKKQAILSRSADLLLKITREQEEKLAIIDEREKERSDLVKSMSDMLSFSFEKVSDISESADLPELWKEKLLHHSYALRELMITLQNISKANEQILLDNKQLFESIIDELTKTHTVGYGPGESSKRGERPLFVDING